MHHPASPKLLKIRFAAIMLPLAIMTLCGCSRNRLFEEKVDITDNRWNAGDFVRFTFQVPDTSYPCDLYLMVRNTTEYDYSNLYLFLHTTLPDSTVAADTIDLNLARPDGKWLGKGIGKFRDSKILLMPGFRFPKTGTYRLEIEQAMRESSISGISAIGLRIEKTNR
jgi:gliding motility-associated lipoprotein GldH